MRKITVVIPRRKSRSLKKILKSKGVSKYVQLPAGKMYKYEVFVTDIITQEVLNMITEKLNIKTGQSTEGGYVTVNPTNLVAPLIQEKGTVVEVDELINKDAKKFIKFDRNYLLFVVCSAVIACIGFQMDNIFILIGSMLISPLMSPIMSVSYGMSKANKSLINNGLRNELLGITIVLIVSVFMSLVPNPSLELEIALANSNFFLTLGLAMVIGLVAANSFITGSFETLTGVAVGISLLPPLTNFVLLVMVGESVFAVGAAFSFIFNILGMHLSALLWFLFVRYLENKKNGNG